MKVLFIRTVPPDKEPRLLAIMNFVKNLGHTVELLLWDRTGEYANIKQWQGFPLYAIYVPSGFGKGVFSAKERIQFVRKAKQFLQKEKFDIVHGCDLDGVMPAVLVKNKKFKVYYDIFDFVYLYPSMGLGLIRKALKLLDYWLYKNVDAIILPDENRKLLIPSRFQKKVIVVPNVPTWNPQKPDGSLLSKLPDNRIKIYYAGVLFPDRGIDMLLELGRMRPDVGIVIAGSGSLEQKVIEYADKLDNIVFLGKLPLSIAQGLYYHITHVWAVYDPSNPINKLSSPNKLFESIIAERIPIMARGTYWDSIVAKHNAGIVIDYSRGVEQLRNYDFEGTFPTLQKQITTLKPLIDQRKRMFEEVLKGVYG